ncbi:GNAT family N-acetyltransferase [Actinosynnema sp. NPDC050436]|uniref:GNAT family N-acetyltransferase n=1 Tax=Actinosynnema sp. NPDC050436 TaxID=3155659 RepID=UPI0033DF1A51
MEPVEINAGEFYLRELRVDDRIDDRVALRAGGRFDHLDAAGAHVAEQRRRWERDESCSWAVCEQLSNTAIGEVSISASGELSCWITPEQRRKGVGTCAVLAVAGFGFGFLELERVTTTPSDEAGERLARACGFESRGPHEVWTRLR